MGKTATDIRAGFASTQRIHIKQIDASERVRKDLGDINALVDSIREVGLLQPMTATATAPATAPATNSLRSKE